VNAAEALAIVPSTFFRSVSSRSNGYVSLLSEVKISNVSAVKSKSRVFGKIFRDVHNLKREEFSIEVNHS
jgi:hypothetical protein